jgi:imidazolonepropionase-like amidohydrolase
MNTPSRLLLIALCAAPAAAQDVLAVKGGRILTIAGPVVEDGTVLIRSGRIAKIGKAAEVEVPWEAKVVDATGKVVLPTWVLANSQGGLRGASANENMQNVPFVTIADILDPASTYFEDSLRNGVGTIHVLPGDATLIGGSGIVVRPIGRTVEDMAVSTQSGLKLSLAAQGGSRMLQIRKLRRALEDAREYLADYDRRKQEFEQEKKAGAIAKDKEWTEEYDRAKKPIIDLLQKKIRGWLYVPGAAEVPEALRLQQELDLVLVLGPKSYKAIAELKAQPRAVVLDDTIEFYDTDPETQDEQKIAVARLFADAGIPFALSLGQGGPTGYPWWQLATCVRQGVDRRTALEALTVVPARILGLQDQLGTLEEGKLGNLQVLTGDPLQATTWVDTVVLEGQVAYERGKDTRLQYLFAGSKAADAAAEGK